MRFGVAIPQRDWPSQADRSLQQGVEYAIRAEALGFDAAWASDHYFLDFGGARQSVGPEPMMLLAAVAAATSRIGVGTLVLCAPLRPPGALAREAVALDELSAGRLTLGLGAGWHEPEFRAFDLPFDHLYSRFEEYLEVLVPLLDGDRVDHAGRFHTVRGGQVLGGSRPRVLVAGVGSRMIALAARLADGWTLPGSYEHFPVKSAELRAAEAAAGRDPGTVTASCGVTALLVEPSAAEQLLTANPPPGPVAVGAEQLGARIAGLEAAGCDEVVLHFSGAAWTNYGIDQLDRAAEALGLSG